VYLFSANGTLLTTFTNPAPVAFDLFGYSVAAVGTDRVLIGARSDDAGVRDAGAAYLFSTNGTLLTTFTDPTTGGGDDFGWSVAAVGSDRVLVGAIQDDTGANNAGAVYLFNIETYAPGVIAAGVRAQSITTISLADGAVTTDKIADRAVTAVKLAPGAATGTHAPVPGTIWFNPIARRFEGFDGANWVPFTVGAPLGAGSTQSFTTPGTFNFVVPAGVSTLGVDIWGGAGGGGAHGFGAVANDCHDGSGLGGGGGGGRGGYVRASVNVTPGETLIVTVGTGGAANAQGVAGSSGGISQIARGGTILVRATGGGGGGAGTQVPFGELNPFMDLQCHPVVSGAAGTSGTATTPGGQVISQGIYPFAWLELGTSGVGPCCDLNDNLSRGGGGHGRYGITSPTPLPQITAGRGGDGANPGVNNHTAGAPGVVRLFWN
jgi:hypothetical protein